MILVGSEAAKQRNCLPAWRKGFTDDVDIHEMSKELKDTLNSRAISIPRSNGGRLYILDNGKRIYDSPYDCISDAILACEDNNIGFFMGNPVWIISPHTQLALKLGYIRYSKVHLDKNLKDIEYWLKTLNLEELRDYHLHVFITMWNKLDRLNGVETDYRVSDEATAFQHLTLF